MTEPQDPYSPPADPYAAPPASTPAPYGAPQYGAPLPPPQRRNRLGIWSLVLGISSVLFLAVLVLPSLTAIGLGMAARARAKRGEASRGLALGGIITGTLGLLVGVAFWSVVVSNRPALDDYQQCTNAADGDKQLQDECVRRVAHDIFGINLPESSR